MYMTLLVVSILSDDLISGRHGIGVIDLSWYSLVSQAKGFSQRAGAHVDVGTISGHGVVSA